MPILDKQDEKKVSEYEKFIKSYENGSSLSNH